MVWGGNIKAAEVTAIWLMFSNKLSKLFMGLTATFMEHYILKHIYNQMELHLYSLNTQILCNIVSSIAIKE